MSGITSREVIPLIEFLASGIAQQQFVAGLVKNAW